MNLYHLLIALITVVAFGPASSLVSFGVSRILPLPVGTKSVLFGYHTWWLHPWFVAWGWLKVYGMTWDPRIWLSFWLHDVGYWGKPNMDGPEGESHPILGARMLSFLFDWPSKSCRCDGTSMVYVGYDESDGLHECDYVPCEKCHRWYFFSLLHSRFLAKQMGREFSKLCVADKKAITLYPVWLWIFLCKLTGELAEYMTHVDGKYEHMALSNESARDLHVSMSEYLNDWVELNKGGESSQVVTIEASGQFEEA